MNVHIHPAIVHFPIALSIFGSMAGLLYLYWRPYASLPTLTWWPLLIGWIATLGAVFSGLFDQRALPPNAPYQSILNWHIGTGLALLVVYGWLLYRRWIFNSAKARQQRVRVGIDYAELLDDPSARWWITGLLIAGMALVIASGWNGGRLVYFWGVNVGIN